MAIVWLCSRFCIFLTQRQLFLRLSFCPRALLPSPLPCWMPPLHPCPAEDTCTLFRFPPDNLIVSAILCLCVCSPCPLQPSHSCHDTSQDCPPAHGALQALQPSLYLSYSDRILPQAFYVPQNSLTVITAISDVSVESLVPRGQLGHLLEFCIMSRSRLLSLTHHPCLSRMARYASLVERSRNTFIGTKWGF